MSLGSLMMQLPKEIRCGIIRHIGPLGMMIAQHVLLGTAIKPYGFAEDPDIYLYGLKFFIWCYENMHIAKTELNIRRFGQPSMVNYVYTRYFEHIEPNKIARDQLIHALYGVISVDCGARPSVVVFNGNDRSKQFNLYSLLKQLMPCVYINRLHAINCADDVIEFTSQIDIRAHTKIVGMRGRVGPDEVESFVAAAGQINITGFNYVIHSPGYEPEPNSGAMIIRSTNPWNGDAISDLTDPVLFEQYILDYCGKK